MSDYKTNIRNSLRAVTVALGAASLMIVTYAFTGYDFHDTLSGRLLPAHQRGLVPWVTITPTMMYSGATLPAHSNVIMHIPKDGTRITRQVLLGRAGKDTRYWGYCFPLDQSTVSSRRAGAFPGDLFLSEAERDKRREKMRTEQRRAFSVFKHLTEKDLNETEKVRGRVRHQKEIFLPGESCYVMTEKPLHVGMDVDDDGLNASAERSFGADPLVADSDGDGIIDGLEVYRLGTHPKRRDSDGDGIIDGVEDKNQNGKVDLDESIPTEWDTDRDGLCDGLCKVNQGTELQGEDKNLNGIYEPDQGEYNPLKTDSDGDGILDEQEYYNCFLAGGDNC